MRCRAAPAPAIGELVEGMVAAVDQKAEAGRLRLERRRWHAKWRLIVATMTLRAAAQTHASNVHASSASSQTRMHTCHVARTVCTAHAYRDGMASVPPPRSHKSAAL